MYIVRTIRVGGIDKQRVLSKEIAARTCAKVIITCSCCSIIAACQLQKVIFEGIAVYAACIIICTCYCGISTYFICPKDIIADRICSKKGDNPAARVVIEGIIADRICSRRGGNPAVRVVIEDIIADYICSRRGDNPAANCVRCIVIHSIVAQRIHASSNDNPAASCVRCIVIHSIVAQRIRTIVGGNPTTGCVCDIVIHSIVTNRIRTIIGDNPTAVAPGNAIAIYCDRAVINISCISSRDSEAVNRYTYAAGTCCQGKYDVVSIAIIKCIIVVNIATQCCHICRNISAACCCVVTALQGQSVGQMKGDVAGIGSDHFRTANVGLFGGFIGTLRYSYSSDNRAIMSCQQGFIQGFIGGGPSGTISAGGDTLIYMENGVGGATGTRAIRQVIA